MPFLAILSKIPLREYFYAAAAIAAVTYYNVHVHNLEVAYGAKQKAAVESAVTLASAQALSAAKKMADAKEAQYTLQLSQVEENYETQLKASDDQHSADLARLRSLEAASGGNTNSVLSGSGGAGSPGDSGGSSLVGLGYVSEELASALRDARADLSQCYAERDSLTGK